MIYLLNAIAGVLFIYVMYRLIKAIYVAYRSPKKILNDAIEDEKERKERINANIKSLKEISQGKMIPVVKAVEEMLESLPQGKKFQYGFEDAKLHIEINSTEYDVFFHVDEIVLDGASHELRAAYTESDRYIVVAGDAPRVEVLGKDNVIKYIAKKIAKHIDLVQD
jgi:hypothetical protein